MKGSGSSFPVLRQRVFLGQLCCHSDDQGLLLFRPGFPQTCCFQVCFSISLETLSLSPPPSCFPLPPSPLISPRSPHTSACPQGHPGVGCGCRHRAEMGGGRGEAVPRKERLRGRWTWSQPRGTGECVWVLTQIRGKGKKRSLSGGTNPERFT